MDVSQPNDVPLPATAGERVPVATGPAVRGETWLYHWEARVAAAPEWVRYLIVACLVAAVGCADYFSGEEISFSIFYLIPISFAAWFLSARAGVGAAVASAWVWFVVEVTQSPDFSSEWIPVWNATMRLGFFLLGVAFVHLRRDAEERLSREVERRTQQLRHELETRRRLEQELLEVTAHEQQRLGQDLHDGLGQYLSALVFHTRALCDDLRRQEAPQVAQVERILGVLRTTNEMIRRLDRALRIPDAAEGGLAAGVRSLAAEVHDLTGIECQLHLTEPLPELGRARVMMLYRVIQEALSNAVKHGHPRAIRVELAEREGILRAAVVDDGRGIAGEAGLAEGSGVQTMQTRAELMGGRLSVLPNAGGGCTVEFLVPVTFQSDLSPRV